MTNAHWSIPPALDARQYLPLARRGVLGAGHVGDAATCPRCNGAVVPMEPPLPARREPPPRAAVSRAERVPAVIAPRRDAAVGVIAPKGDAAPVVTAPIVEAVGETRATETSVRASAGPASGPSIRNLVLLGAYDATEGGTRDVSTAQIIVAAWKRAPLRLGIPGFETQHPDSNRVLVKLCGVVGLCALGLVERPSRSQYRLTRKGRRRALALIRQAPANARQTVSLTADGAS